MSQSADISRDQVDRLAEDFLARFRRGDRPSMDDIDRYAKQFPEIGEQVAEVIQVLLLMENLGAESADGDDNASIQIPEQLGEYRIVRELGRGGMGVVYEAIQAELGRHVALKVLPAMSLLKSSQLARFRREAKAAARLHHTNIVPVFGVGSKDGVHYYAMQLIEGQSLDHVLKDIRRQRSSGDSPETIRDAASTLNQSAISNYSNRHEHTRAVARIGQQIADALSHAHSQGMLHRDVKPSNIILDQAGRAWLSDFGMALFDDSEQLTGTGDVVGTLRYMAPERFKGRCDARSDVYSLGLTLYELLTAKSAVFEVDRAKLVHQVLNEDPPAPRTVDPTVPRDLETIVLKSICKEPAYRYQSATELDEDLTRFLADRPLAARRLSWWERTQRWVQRNRGLTIMAAVAFGTLLLGLLMTYSQWRRAANSLDEVKRQTDRAQTSISIARNTIDALFHTFNEDSLAARSMPLPLRKNLLTLAIKHHQELAALSDDDPEIQAELARSYLRIATMQASVGVGSEAVKACEQAEELLLRSIRKNPNHEMLRALLANVSSQLGYYQLGMNRVAAARQALDRAITIWSELLSKKPDDPDYLNGLARSYNCLGHLLSPFKSSTDTLSESVEYNERAVSIRRKIVTLYPDNKFYNSSLALAITNLASRKLQTHEFEEAVALQQECIRLFEELLTTESDSVELQYRLAKGHNHLGDMYRSFGRLPDRYVLASEQYIQALESQKRLALDNPGAVAIKRDLANTLANLSEIHFAQAEYEQSKTRCEECLELFEEMLRQEPQSIDRAELCSRLRNMGRILVKLNRPEDAIFYRLRCVEECRGLLAGGDERPSTRASLFAYLRELSPLLRQLGRFGEAITTASERRVLAKGKANELFSVSQDLAETAKSITQNNAGSAEDLLRQSTELSLDVLQEAIAAGWKDFEKLRSDTQADKSPFVFVWTQSNYTKLPPELAFAFAVRARRHLANAEFFEAAGDVRRLIAQGFTEPSTYGALASLYLDFPIVLQDALK